MTRRSRYFFPGRASSNRARSCALTSVLWISYPRFWPLYLAAILAVSVGLVAAFVVRQSRVTNPLMPLRLFRSRQVTGANIAQALLVVGMFSMFFLGALYLQRILGYDALEVGLAFLPTTVAMGIMSLRVSGPLTMRYGLRATLISSIKDKLLPLGDDVGFICGHGAGSSFGQERLTNPFVTGEIEG